MRENKERIRNILTVGDKRPGRWLLPLSILLMLFCCFALVSCQRQKPAPSLVMEVQYYGKPENYIELPVLALSEGESITDGVAAINQALSELRAFYQPVTEGMAERAGLPSRETQCLLYPTETDRYLNLLFFRNTYHTDLNTGHITSLVYDKEDGAQVTLEQALEMAGQTESELLLALGNQYDQYAVSGLQPLVPAEECMELEPPLWRQWFFAGSAPEGGFSSPAGAQSQTLLETLYEPVADQISLDAGSVPTMAQAAPTLLQSYTQEGYTMAAASFQAADTTYFVMGVVEKRTGCPTGPPYLAAAPGGVERFQRSQSEDGSKWIPYTTESFYSVPEDNLPLDVYDAIRAWLEAFTREECNPWNLPNASAVWQISSITPQQGGWENGTVYSVVARADCEEDLYCKVSIRFNHTSKTVSGAFSSIMGSKAALDIGFSHTTYPLPLSDGRTLTVELEEAPLPEQDNTVLIR